MAAGGIVWLRRALVIFKKHNIYFDCKKIILSLYEIHTIMIEISIEKLEQEVISIIQDVCKHQGIEEIVNCDFIPGNYIMSQVLVSIFPQIEIKTDIDIPINCYIFHDNKTKKQLNIKEAVYKLLKLQK